MAEYLFQVGLSVAFIVCENFFEFFKDANSLIARSDWCV